ncbi:hypothetical protein PSENEW3_00004667 [Picochlorum sp. SENEW3]|nr:hypothetical protein PSENEW3_00004667 [Picochlorum sp. SENEW3]
MSRRRPVEWIRDIFVAPFTEEICFRSALMSFLWLGGMNMSTTMLFAKTGQLMAPLAAHAVCNFFGVPRFGELRQMSPQNYARCIIVCHMLGVCGFVVACYMVIQ